MNEMIAAHQQAIIVNHSQWHLWLLSFMAGRFQRSISSVQLASDEFKGAIQKFTDAVNALGPIDDDAEGE